MYDDVPTNEISPAELSSLEKKMKRKPTRKQILAQFQPLDITHADAFARLTALPYGTSIKELARVLHNEGVKVSVSTLRKWSSRHRWTAQLREKFDNVDPSKTSVWLGQLEEIGERPAVPLLQGLTARMVRRLDTALDDVEMATPQDVVTMVKAIKDMGDVVNLFRVAATPFEPGTRDLEGTTSIQPDHEDRPTIGKFAGFVVEGGEGGKV